jgi:hypothetical protein
MASAAGSPHCVAFARQRELQSVTETAVDPEVPVPDVPDVPVVVLLHAVLATAAGRTERTTKTREIRIAAV